MYIYLTTYLFAVSYDVTTREIWNYQFNKKYDSNFSDNDLYIYSGLLLICDTDLKNSIFGILGNYCQLNFTIVF